MQAPLSRADTPGPRPGFTCFKSTAPILYPARWHRDALLWAALEPSISRMHPHAHPVVDGPFSFVVERAGRALLICVGEDRATPAPPPDLPVVRIGRREVLAEPRATAARAVWATRATAVAAGDRLRVVATLRASHSGVPIGLLAEQVRLGDDGVACVLALACSGHAVVDVSTGLSPETRVRLGPMAALDADPASDPIMARLNAAGS